MCVCVLNVFFYFPALWVLWFSRCPHYSLGTIETPTCWIMFDGCSSFFQSTDPDPHALALPEDALAEAEAKRVRFGHVVRPCMYSIQSSQTS